MLLRMSLKWTGCASGGDWEPALPVPYDSSSGWNGFDTVGFTLKTPSSSGRSLWQSYLTTNKLSCAEILFSCPFWLDWVCSLIESGLSHKQWPLNERVGGGHGSQSGNDLSYSNKDGEGLFANMFWYAGRGSGRGNALRCIEKWEAPWKLKRASYALICEE